MKVIVVTSTSPYRKEMFDLTYQNMIEYTNKHHYDRYVIYLEDNVWAYKKHERFKKLFDEGYDVILYKDDDSLFTNMTIHTESFIDFRHALFITKDKGGINGGVMILVKENGGNRLNDIILAYSDKYPNEQDLLNDPDLYETLKGRISILPQQSINSYLYDNYPEIGKQKHEDGQFEEGDFILHLPAMTIEKRVEIIKNTPIVR